MLIWTTLTKAPLYYTVGAHSIARLCQNLVNCRRNIWAHRRRKKLLFFLFEKSWAGEWVKILTKVNSYNIFVWNPFESAYKKLYSLRVNMAIKSLEKINFRKKTEVILLLDITNWYWGQELFCHLIWSLYIDSKFHIFTGGHKVQPVCVKTRKIVGGISQPTEDAKSCGFFLFQRTWAGEWYKILTNLKILKIFVHIVSL